MDGFYFFADCRVSVDSQELSFLGFKLDASCLGSVIKLYYFVLGYVVYCIYISMSDSYHSIVCVTAVSLCGLMVVGMFPV